VYASLSRKRSSPPRARRTASKVEVGFCCCLLWCVCRQPNGVQIGLDAHIGGQSPMNGTFVSDLQKSLALLISQLADQEDLSSIRSTKPALVSQPMQSSAWTLPCFNRTRTISSGHRFRSAYIRIVMLVHEPSAARRSSYGFGPESRPPTSNCSSACN
jgi:hypothetical protein